MKARYKWMANIKEGVVWCCPPVSLSWGPPKQPQFPLTDVKVAKFTSVVGSVVGEFPVCHQAF